jgi:hypothetical protein
VVTAGAQRFGERRVGTVLNDDAALVARPFHPELGCNNARRHAIRAIL